MIPLYILAGGQSRRFGSDKARATIGGVPLIVRVAEALRPKAASVTVVAAEAGAYEDLGLTTIADRVGGLGPMGGLAAALGDRERTAGAGWIALVSCDWLNADAAWLRPLLGRACRDRLEAGCLAYRSERWEPMPGLYHTSIRPAVEERLATRDRAMWRLLESVRARAVDRPAGLEQLRQANTPASLEDHVRADRSAAS